MMLGASGCAIAPGACVRIAPLGPHPQVRHRNLATRRQTAKSQLTIVQKSVMPYLLLPLNVRLPTTG
jgi:hypothetical protein